MLGAVSATQTTVVTNPFSQVGLKIIWENADQDGIWNGDASTLAAKFDVSEDAGAEVLDHLRARRLIEKLYTGKYIIVSWRDRDAGDSTRHSIRM
jgi:hypothetical protein